MIRRFIAFIAGTVRERRTIIALARNDFRHRYLGSYLGITWAFVQPIMTLAILWFVFEMGFKTGPVNSYPFVLWLLVALIPWNFLADAISNGTNSIVEHDYLVKKVVFRVSVLPVVKVLSSFFVHAVFLAIMFAIFICMHRTPGIHAIQILYYEACLLMLVLGVSWCTAALIVFVKDLGQIVALVLQFGFWLTPIFWQIDTVPEKYQQILRLNPAYYITEGFRDSLLRDVWFWERPELTLYFLVLTSALFVIGAFVFMRLRPHFADVI